MKNLMMLALCAASAQAAMTVHAPAGIPQGWRATSERPAGDMVFNNLMIGMKRSNRATLKRLAAEVSNPKSTSYLQYPTYEQVGDLVRPQAAHTAAVKAWLAEHGAEIMSEHPHGDYIKIRATAAQLEKMAGSELMTFEHTSGKKIHRMVDGVRVADEVAAAIDSFTGFHTFPMDMGKRVVNTDELAPCAVTPGFLRDTYNVSRTSSGGARNIQAIGQFLGQYVSNSDLSSFCEQYDPETQSCKISKYRGDPNDPSRPGVESMLDTEYMVPVSYGEETWVYSYESDATCGIFQQFFAELTQESTYPYVASISYGSQAANSCPPSIESRLEDDLEKLAVMGVSVLISSGDDGSGHSTRSGVNPGQLVPSFPASAPYATAVGSTFFARGTSGPEQATTSFGSGGGFSFDFDVPDYQADAVSSYLSKVPNLPTRYEYAQNGRGTPDVSALGEQFTVVSGGRFAGCVGGTSASSPSFGAILTLLNNVCLAEGGKTLGFANPLFYQNPGMFRDVKLGTNAVAGNTEGWAAVDGWDASTGLGTPDFPSMLAVVKQVCGAARK